MVPKWPATIEGSFVFGVQAIAFPMTWTLRRYSDNNRVRKSWRAMK
jgi:hypothetical protein